MRINIWVEDVRNGTILEDLGTHLTDSPGRAVQMYIGHCDKWEAKGHWAEVMWRDITNPSAAALGKLGGRVTSPRKAKSSRTNGRKGGRPRKQPAA